MHKNSERLFRMYAQHLFRPGMIVLEVGPDKSPSTYYDIVGDKTIRWDTADIKSLPPGEITGTQFVMSDPYTILAEPCTYDIVLTGQVIEQVHECWTWVKELARVLKRTGKLIIINPISWPNESPVDAWRIYPPGMKALYKFGEVDADISVFGSIDDELTPEICQYCGRNVCGVVDCITVGTKR